MKLRKRWAELKFATPAVMQEIKCSQVVANSLMKRAKAEGKQIESESGWICASGENCICGGGGYNFKLRENKKPIPHPNEVLQRRRLEEKLSKLLPSSLDDKGALALTIYRDSVKLYPKMDKEYLIETSLKYSGLDSYRWGSTWSEYKEVRDLLLAEKAKTDV